MDSWPQRVNDLLSSSAGDLRPWRVVYLQSAIAFRGPGCCGILLSPIEPAHKEQTQEDACQVEGDVRQVRP